MFPTLARLSKASRRPLTPKRGNKDYYKGMLRRTQLRKLELKLCGLGTRQAFLPGGLRTGAPGKHVIGGKAKYRLLDEKVRVFVAPPIEEILSSPLKPYVSVAVNLKPAEAQAVFGRFPDSRGLSPEHFLKVARERTAGELRAQEEANKPTLSWPKRLLMKKSEDATTKLPEVVEAETPKAVPEAVILEEVPRTSQTTARKGH
ncbi:hypothetical protein H0H87_000988 [Tephrocybe sp. NHM501043]|nr:hypothetical protein H0H87_000988 [Tephrocybe sp. NHM501043]